MKQNTKQSCDTRKNTAVFFGITTGTALTILCKTIYMITSVGIEDKKGRFEKPLTVTWVIFLGMGLILPYHFIYERFFLPENKRSVFDKKVLGFLMIPACFEVFSTAIAQVALLSLSASVFQITRCFVVIFTAILKHFLLRQQMRRYMWIGACVSFFGLALVSSTAFIQPFQLENELDARLGIMFLLFSCLIQGLQFIFEEKVLLNESAPPLVVVGMEGLWASIFMIIVVFPIAFFIPGSDKGSLENLHDSLVMFQNSDQIQALICVLLFTVFIYYVFSIFVTHMINLIWHAVSDNLTIITIWIVNLIIYYSTNQRFGEAWTYLSGIELVGLLILFFGTAIYNGSVTYFYSVDYQEVIEQRKLSRSFWDNLIRIPESFASPTLMRSPMIRRRQSNLYNSYRRNTTDSSSTNKAKFGYEIRSSPLQDKYTSVDC